MDHAYIDEEGMIRGGSSHICATITGDVSADESVVIDFSKCKKLLKMFIDDPIYGFDHKLLLYPFSRYAITQLKDDYVAIDTPYFNTICPTNAVRIVTEDEFDQYLTMMLAEHYPDINVEVKSKAHQSLITDGGTMFIYSHGLKHSSSWGCQNQNHGHTSFVEVIDKHGNNVVSLQRMIAFYLDRAVLINKENVVLIDDNHVIIEYMSDTRGVFRSIYFHPHKWIVLDTESTIEYIIEYIREKFYDELRGHTVRISEGLSKGSEITIPL